MEASASLQQSSVQSASVAAPLGRTRDDLSSSLPGTKELSTTFREGMSLIDRFYKGGNRAHPEALAILVVVLDQIVVRMRDQYAKRVKDTMACNEKIRVIDASIARTLPKQRQLEQELAEKRAQADELRRDIGHGETSMKDAIELAKEALQNAKIATRKAEGKVSAQAQRDLRGYDSKGRPLPGVLHAACCYPQSDVDSTCKAS
uniref:Uncharacterized protein n=1 Tax=Chrysotila carterae TaxID=13221 RepID=A0A7S4EUH5_CHRCT|eukprot:6175486-Pleurochrysis_carterae.AAC.2